jgi:hypothetical protein
MKQRFAVVVAAVVVATPTRAYCHVVAHAHRVVHQQYIGATVLFAALQAINYILLLLLVTISCSVIVCTYHSSAISSLAPYNHFTSYSAFSSM